MWREPCANARPLATAQGSGDEADELRVMEQGNAAGDSGQDSVLKIRLGSQRLPESESDFRQTTNGGLPVRHASQHDFQFRWNCSTLLRAPFFFFRVLTSHPPPVFLLYYPQSTMEFFVLSFIDKTHFQLFFFPLDNSADYQNVDRFFF